MAISYSDPMAFLNEQITRGQEKTDFRPNYLNVVFSLKDGEKALVRPLVEMNQYAAVNFHEAFNQANPKDSIRAVCAEDFGSTCLLCQKAAQDKKLAASLRFVLPVYVHKIVIKEIGANGKPVLRNGQPAWKTVVYKNQAGEEIEINGVRLLVLKRTASLLMDLNGYYAESGSITGNDFVIIRTGTQLETKYNLIAKPASAFTVELEGDTDFQTEALKYRLFDVAPMISLDDAPALVAPVPTNGKTGKAVIDDDF